MIDFTLSKLFALYIKMQFIVYVEYEAFGFVEKQGPQGPQKLSSLKSLKSNPPSPKKHENVP